MNDNATTIEPTSDGGYITVGSTFSNNGDVTGAHGQSDAWVVKLDAAGAVEWQRALGGSMFDDGRAVLECPDGGFLIAGGTSSNDGDVSGNHGGGDGWVVKLNAAGEVDWQRTYGGTEADVIFDLTETPEGDFMLACDTRSSDGDVTESFGSSDYWIVRISPMGDILWQGTFGGNDIDVPLSIETTSDGGFVVCGYSYSTNGDVSGNHGEGDYWVIKLDSVGELQWQCAAGGSLYDVAYDVIETVDGGFMVSGLGSSLDGDVTDHIGSDDLWVVKLESNGEIEWTRSYGGSQNDVGRAVLRIAADGYMIVGYTNSTDGDILGNNGGYDGWCARIDLTGDIVWKSSFGGPGNEYFADVNITTNGGYVLAGISGLPTGGDVTANNGGADLWAIKLGPDPTFIATDQMGQGFSMYPNPCTDRVVVKWISSDPPVRIQLSDTRGAIAREWLTTGSMAEGSSGPFDLSGLLPGSYYLIVTSGTRRSALPVVKL